MYYINYVYKIYYIVLCPRKVQSIDKILSLSISFLLLGFLGCPGSGTERTRGRHTLHTGQGPRTMEDTPLWWKGSQSAAAPPSCNRGAACVHLVAATGCPVGIFFICPSVLLCVTGALKINKNILYLINFIEVIPRDEKKTMLTIPE